jgi:hypothetical protein
LPFDLFFASKLMILGILRVPAVNADIPMRHRHSTLPDTGNVSERIAVIRKDGFADEPSIGVASPLFRL